MTGSPSRPGSSGARRRSFVAALVALALLLSGSLGVNIVGAQSVDDARAEAESLATDLADARERLIVLAEEYNRATADLEAAQAEVAANLAQLEANQVELDAAQAQLREYAVAAYVSGGGERELDGFFGGNADSVDQRLNYLRSAAGNKKQLLDGLAHARKLVEGQRQQLELAQVAAGAEQARIDASRAEAAELEASAADLLEGANGRLATLVAEVDARRAAEERDAALAAARQADITVEVDFVPAASPVRDTATDTANDSAADSAVAVPAAPVVYTPPPGLRREAAIAVQAAMTQLGVPYVWGGSRPDQGFDCSGLMYWAYAQAGVGISRPADYQRDDAIRIGYEDLQPGDLVFYGEPPSHVGMYIGNDEILNAPQTGDVVSIKNMFYSSKPMTYGRIA